MLRPTLLAVWIAALGCSSEDPTTAPDDAAPEADALAPIDGEMTDRGSVPRDLPTGQDVGVRDTGVRDAGPLDTGVRDTGVRDTGAVDTGVRDTGVIPTDIGGVPAAGPALPAWDAATVAHVREVRARGAATGARGTVFAKIGDSITESGSYLSDLGFGWYTLGSYGSLEGTIRYFRATALGGADTNSFNRASQCATAGWTTDDALGGGSNSPLQQEIRAIHPGWAIVMYGTNDIDRSNLTTYLANMNRILDVLEGAGVVTAISTIPDRMDGSGPAALGIRFNDAIRTLAATRHVPLLDYWAALQPLPNHGVSDDRIHPSVYFAGGSTAPGDFTAAGLRYGYNMRNLTAVQMLDRMRTLP